MTPSGSYPQLWFGLRCFYKSFARLSLTGTSHDSHLGKGNSLKSSLECVPSISLPHCYFSRISAEVISFIPCGVCDASLKAHAGVVYLLIETKAGFFVQFIAAKTHVVPIRNQSILRLELLLALLLAWLLTSVMHSHQDEMQLAPPRCFMDSTVSICWIKSTDKT